MSQSALMTKWRIQREHSYPYLTGYSAEHWMNENHCFSVFNSIFYTAPLALQLIRWQKNDYHDTMNHEKKCNHLFLKYLITVKTILALLLKFICMQCGLRFIAYLGQLVA